TGAIHKWHFVWGGQYTTLPDSPMSVNTSYSYIQNTVTSGAQFAPAWSGWSVMDNGTNPDPTSVQSNYTVGSTVTFSLPGGTPTGGQPPQIVVMAVSSGMVTGWQWLNYGSYSAIPSSPTNLIQASTSIATPRTTKTQAGARGYKLYVTS